MRKRICNKVLLKFISVGAFFFGGGEEMGKLPVSHAFFVGGEGMGKLPISHAFLVGKLPVSHVLFWGGVGWAVGKVPVSHTKNLSHLHFSFKNQEMARQPITYGPHFFSLKVTVIEGLLMFFFLSL